MILLKKLFAMAVAFVLLLSFIPAYAEGEAVTTNMVIDGVEVTDIEIKKHNGNIGSDVIFSTDVGKHNVEIIL